MVVVFGDILVDSILDGQTTAPDSDGGNNGLRKLQKRRQQADNGSRVVVLW